MKMIAIFFLILGFNFYFFGHGKLFSHLLSRSERLDKLVCKKQVLFKIFKFGTVFVFHYVLPSLFPIIKVNSN